MWNPLRKCVSRRQLIHPLLASKMIDILELAERYDIDLQKQGDLYVGFCPFHDDKNRANFTVYSKTNSYFCFPPGTPVYTEKGSKRIEDITIGEKVLSHDGLFHEVSQLHNRSFAGDLVSLDIWGIGRSWVVATPNHKILAKKFVKASWKGLNGHALVKEYTNDIDWIEISQLKKDDYVALQFPREVKKVNHLFINEILEDTDVSSKYVFHKNYKQLRIFNKIKVDKDLLRLIGYYLAEGFLGSSIPPAKTRASGISFSFHKKEKAYIKDVQDIILRKFGVKSLLYKDTGDKSVRIIVSSTVLGELFKKLFGTNSKNKSIPSWIMTLPHVLQQELLIGVLRGDGHFSRKFTQLTLSNFNLILQLWMVAARSGLIFSIYKEKIKVGGNFIKGAEVICNVNPSKLQLWHGTSSDLSLIERAFGKNILKKFTHNYYKIENNHILFRIREVSIEKYKGDVYNLGVEDTHTYVVGNICVHNCYTCSIGGDAIDFLSRIEKISRSEAQQRLEGDLQGLIDKLNSSPAEESYSSTTGLQVSKLLHDFLVDYPELLSKVIAVMQDIDGRLTRDIDQQQAVAIVSDVAARLKNLEATCINKK